MLEKNKIIDQMEKNLDDLTETTALATLESDRYDVYDLHNAAMKYSADTQDLLKKLKTLQ
jgi:hypothetical protein